ncbi:MAG: hypothetical protein ACK4K9_11525, partial [Bacteroidia bacterium]
MNKITCNSTYKKLAVLRLNKALCFVSSLVVADSLVLRKRQLLVAAFQDQKQIFFDFFTLHIYLIQHTVYLDSLSQIFLTPVCS